MKATNSWGSRLVQLTRELAYSPPGAGLGTGGLVVLADVVGSRVGRRSAGVATAAALTATTVGFARASIERQIRNSEDVASVLAAIGPFAPPLGTWAIEADFGQLVAAELRGRPRVVVECGSGITTLLIGAWLRANGHGELYSLEHDEAFAEETQRYVDKGGLGDWVHIVKAPLTHQVIHGTEKLWYEPGAVQELPPSIDLLVVDGPPASTRWPAVPVLYDRLAGDAVALLDDGRRRHVRRMAQEWAEEFPDLEVYWHDTVKGSWKVVRTAAVHPEPGIERLLRSVRRGISPRPSSSARWPVRR